MRRGKNDPGWAELVESWKAEQAALRGRMVVTPLEAVPRFVAGADAAFSADGEQVLAVALVYDREAGRVVEVQSARRPVEVPYIPGFLAFREGPAVTEAIVKLRHPFGIVCFDGQGYAHPRRCGLATYVSVKLDVPGVGIAKSRFIGTFVEPGLKAGAYSPLMDAGEEIGIVLRTKDKTNPVFVSVGHRVDLDSARRVALACCTRYRIPEPTRQADVEVGKLKRQG
jgi:deoxyribonuclease V